MAAIPPLLRLTRPADADVDAVVAAVGRAPFTYAPVGATAGTLPEGWHHDTATGEVGRGAEDASAAERAVRAWAMFDLGWVTPRATDRPQQAGEVVAFTARTFGVWSINVCRIVDRIEQDDGRVRRIGFRYGTLPGHVLRGEEAFELVWDRDTGGVTFTVRKFSRPNHPLAHAMGPLLRRVQHRFSLDAIARVGRAVAEAR